MNFKITQKIHKINALFYYNSSINASKFFPQQVKKEEEERAVFYF